MGSEAEFPPQFHKQTVVYTQWNLIRPFKVSNSDNATMWTNLMVIRLSEIKKLPNCLPKWLHHFASLPATSGGSCYSASSRAFGALSVFLDFGHSHGCVMAFLGCFNLHSLNVR